MADLREGPGAPPNNGGSKGGTGGRPPYSGGSRGGAGGLTPIIFIFYSDSPLPPCFQLETISILSLRSQRHLIISSV